MNNRKNELKNIKGITLIALVVAIIVLMILAGISINLILGNNGIITKSKLARENMQIAANEEQEQLDGAIDQIDEIMSNTPSSSQGKITSIIFNESQLTLAPDTEISLNVTIMPENASNKELEWTSTNTDVATIDNNGKLTTLQEGSTTIIAKAKDGSNTSASCALTVTTIPLANAVQIGDYVAYDPTKEVTDTSKLTYISPKGTGKSHGNGSGQQTFTASNDRKWRVLSKNETTGEVVLLLEHGLSPTEHSYFYMKGAIGYLYAEQELNSICAIYGYGKGANTTKTYTYQTGGPLDTLTSGTITSGARSINVGDVNNIIGYTIPTTGTSHNANEYYITSTTESGWSDARTSMSYEDLSYYYNPQDYFEEGNVLRTMLFNQGGYLASRFMGWDTYDWKFGTYALSSAVMGQSKLANGGFVSGSDILCNQNTVRPIVYLKTTVQTNGKDDNGDWMIIDN